MSESIPDDDVAAALLDKAIGMLEDELQGHPDPLLVMVPHEQKAEFLSHFQRFRKQLANGELPPPPERSAGMAEEVITNWPFSYLGEVIVRAERAWKQYTPPGNTTKGSDDSVVSGTIAPDRRRKNGTSGQV